MSIFLFFFLGGGRGGGNFQTSMLYVRGGVLYEGVQVRFAVLQVDVRWGGTCSFKATLDIWVGGFRRFTSKICE